VGAVLPEENGIIVFFLWRIAAMQYRFRRLFFLIVLLLALAPSLLLVRAAEDKAKTPITGRAVPRLQALDQIMLDTLREHNIPGGSLAVAKDGRLVFAHGFGWARMRPHGSASFGSLLHSGVFLGLILRFDC
jgi:CubicO group peptidase (beta-lactamase class C family)